MKEKGKYGKRPKRQYHPPETIPDTLKVPENTILMIPFSRGNEQLTPYFKPLGKTRDWFEDHAYFCLPLVFGNLHGFILTSPFDFVVRWDGENSLEALQIHCFSDEKPARFNTILESHFGSGILTIQFGMTLRTPENINLLVKEPPNYAKDGVCWLNAVVETDNLRRDFTFNIKITRPHCDVVFKKGDPLGCILPYPRYFFDSYKMEMLTDPKELTRARKTMKYFGVERDDYDQGLPALRYMEGEDIYGIPFKHHQKALDNGAWWQSKESKQKDAPAKKSETKKPRKK